MNGSLLGVAGYSLVVLLALEARFHLRSRRHPQLGAVSVTFTDEGIEARTPRLESRTLWSYYTKSRETPTYLFVKAKGHGTTVIPKRFFGDASELAEVRQLIKDHVPGQR